MTTSIGCNGRLFPTPVEEVEAEEPHQMSATSTAAETEPQLQGDAWFDAHDRFREHLRSHGWY